VGHPNTIFVTNLHDLPHYTRELRPARLVSIIQPMFQPERPPEVAADAHLRVGVDDITEDDLGGILITEAEVRELVGFIEDWQPAQGALLAHCYAGVSRSTATALIAHYLKTGDARASAAALRSASPHAEPNRLVVSLADRVLGCGGALSAAREQMGTSDLIVEPLTTLRL